MDFAVGTEHGGAGMVLASVLVNFPADNDAPVSDPDPRIYLGAHTAQQASRVIRKTEGEITRAIERRPQKFGPDRAIVTGDESGIHAAATMEEFSAAPAKIRNPSPGVRSGPQTKQRLKTWSSNAR